MGKYLTDLIAGYTDNVKFKEDIRFTDASRGAAGRGPMTAGLSRDVSWPFESS